MVAKNVILAAALTALVAIWSPFLLNYVFVGGPPAEPHHTKLMRAFWWDKEGRMPCLFCLVEHERKSTHSPSLFLVQGMTAMTFHFARVLSLCQSVERAKC